MKTLFYIGLLIAAPIFISSITPKSEALPEVKAKNKSATMSFYNKVYNEHNPEMVDALIDADYLEHQSVRHYSRGKAGLKKELKDFFVAFPDVHVTVNFMTADQDLVTAQITITGTNSGSWNGLPATNRKINISGVDVIRYKNAKGLEHWGYVEEGKLLHQLGLIGELREARNEQVQTE